MRHHLFDMTLVMYVYNFLQIPTSLLTVDVFKFCTLNVSESCIRIQLGCVCLERIHRSAVDSVDRITEFDQPSRTHLPAEMSLCAICEYLSRKTLDFILLDLNCVYACHQKDSMFVHSL